MKHKSTILASVLFLISSTGITLFLTLYFQLKNFTIARHSYSFSPFAFFSIFFCVFFLLFLFWIFLCRIDVNLSKDNPYAAQIRNLISFIPFSFFIISPVLCKFYMTQKDLKSRLNILAALILLTFLVIKFVIYKISLKKRIFYLQKLEQRFLSLSLKKKLIILFIISFLIYNLCTLVLVMKGTTFSGDEPYYLLTTHSLLKDKDINVANNYVNKDYFSFYSKEKNPKLRLGIYGRQGKKGKNYIYPINLPGISALMIPHYWLSQFFKGKILTFIIKGSLSIWAVLLGLQLFLFTRELWGKERISIILWFLFTLTSPILFYAIHLYPEIPISLFSLYVFRKAYSNKKLSVFHYLFMGFLLGLFPWFGLKYNVILGPLLLVTLYFLWKQHKVRIKLLYFLFFPLVSFFLFYYFIYSLYGTFSPFSIYQGIMTPEKAQAFRTMILKIPVMLRIDSFFDYFLDQRDGLLLYSPLYFFSFLGLVEVFRRKKRDFFIFLFILLPFILNYAFLTHRQGASPQGRVLTPVSWILMLLIGYFLVFNKKQLYTFVFGLFSFISLAISGLLLLNPSFLYQPTTHEHTLRAGDMFVYLSNINFFLPHYLPSFIKIDNTGYLPNYLWVMAVLVFILVYAFSKSQLRIKPVFSVTACLFLLSLSIFLWALFPGNSLYPTKVFRYSPQKAMGFYMSPMGKGVVAKKMAEFYLHYDKSYKIIFSSRRKLNQIKINFGSEEGKYKVNIDFFDMNVFRGKTINEKKEITYTPTAYYPFKKLYLYEININIEHLSSELMLRNPYFIQIIPLN
ncbi:MAG: hypothetical protein ACOC6P_01470 [Candidatus Aminicenantaceae bacterium]